MRLIAPHSPGHLAIGLQYIRRFTRIVLLALALSAGIASVVAPTVAHAEDKEKPADPNADPFDGQTVQEIDIRGLARVDEGTVLRKIRTRKGRPFDRKVWDEDWHRLDESGLFLNVRTTEPIVWPGGIKLAVDLVEKAVISKITFRGNSAVNSTRLLNTIKSNEGGRYDKGQIHLDKVAIEKFFQEKAYRSIKVEYAVETVSSHRQMIGGKEVEVEDEVRVIFTVDEGNPVGVRIIKFEGNTAFKEKELLAQMTTKYRRLFRAGDLKDEELEIDKKRLEAYYLKAGYMDVEITQVEIKVSEETYFNWFRRRKRLAEVVIHINEGPQYFTGRLEIKSANANALTITEEEIRSVMKVKPGAVFSDNLLQDDIQRIQDLYGERGMVFTKVEPDRKLVTEPERTKENPNQYDVSLAIRESGEVILREVITRGNTKTRDKVIIRQMELFPGERIDTTKMKIAVQRLRNLNYFEEDIRITPEQTDNPEEANLVIDVAEKSTGEFNFGVGISSVDSVVGNVKLTQRNFDFKDFPKSWRDALSGNSFVGAGQTFTIDLSGGAKRQNYTISFFEPWAFDRPIRLGGSIFRTVNNYADFNQTNTGFSASVGKRMWGPRWDGEVAYRFSYTELGDQPRNVPPILKEQEGAQILSSLTPRLVYDSRDSRLQPSRGWLAEASIEFGGGPLLGSYTWVRPTLEVSRFFTVFKLPSGRKHILDLVGKATMIEAFGSTEEVPPFLRNNAGGIGTIRGFQFRSITPYANGYQIGGKKMILASAEYSLPLYEEIVRGSIFLDGGEVWDAGDAGARTKITNESGFRASTGVGLAVRTPFSPLPIRIYFSNALIKNDQDRTKTIDFTFGTKF